MSAQLISDEDAANQDTGSCEVDRRACQESLAAKLKVGGVKREHELEILEKMASVISTPTTGQGNKDDEDEDALFA